MATLKFVWILRSWCSIDSYWEHVREHKEYDIAYANPELLLQEIERVVMKEQEDWKDIQESSTTLSQRKFDIEIPTLEQIKSRSFFKFMTTTDSDFMQSWYIERLKVVD